MKTLKNAFFFTFLAISLINCGGGSGTDVTTNPDSTNTELTSATSNTSSETNSTSTTSEEEDASGKITDDIVKQACNCQESARRKDGTIDFPKMGECMGNKNKIQFVADLLGPSASEKQRADAERILTKKMDSKCPKNR